MSMCYTIESSAKDGAIKRVGNVFYVVDTLDLGGGVWEVPKDCIVEFDGGLVKNGSLLGRNTLLKGDVSLDCYLHGSFSNDTIYISWFNTSDVTQLSRMIASVFNLDQKVKVFIDKTIHLDGEQYDVKNVLLYSNGYSIISPSCYRVRGDVIINNLNFECVKSKEVFLDLSHSESITPTIQIESILFDANYHLDRLLYASSDFIKKALLRVIDSSFTHFNRYVIIMQSECTGIVSNCSFTNIGDGKADHVCAIWLGTENHNGRYGACNFFIEDNIFKGIKASYSEVAESREAHAVLIYGHFNSITNNYISCIYSDSATADPGFDSEGIYIKGGDNSVVNNTLIDAVGSGPDGAITVKSSFRNNSITHNYISHSFGSGILCCTSNSTIDNNIILSRKAAILAFSILDNSGGVYTSNRVIGDVSLNKKTFKAAFFVSRSSDVLIKNNKVECIPTLLVTYPNLGNIELRDNFFDPGVVHYGQESYYTAPISLHEENICRLLIINNEFTLTGIRSSQIIESWSKSDAVVVFLNNTVSFLPRDESERDLSSYFVFFYRNCKPQSNNNVLKINLKSSLGELTNDIQQIKTGFNYLIEE